MMLNKRLFILLVISFLLSCLNAVIVQDQLTKVFTLEPGETGIEYININNPDDKILQVKISQADYIYNAKDDNWYLEPGKYNRSNAKWITVSQNVNLNAYESISLPVKVSVPNDITLKGSYWSVIFIEDASPAVVDDNVSNDNLIFAYRYAIQIVTNIKDTGEMDLEFKNFIIEKLDSTNTQIITFDLNNYGNLWVDALIKIDIFDDKTNFIGSFYAKNQKVYPGLDKKVSVPLIPLKTSENGKLITYYAVLVADCGNSKIFGHQFSFSVK